MYRYFSDVPLSFQFNTRYMPKREPLTIPHDASIELPHYLAFLDRQSQTANTAGLPPEGRADSLMTQFQKIKHEIMCRGFSRMGCLAHTQDMSQVGLDWKVCGKLLEDGVDIAKNISAKTRESNSEKGDELPDFP